MCASYFQALNSSLITQNSVLFSLHFEPNYIQSFGKYFFRFIRGVSIQIDRVLFNCKYSSISPYKRNAERHREKLCLNTYILYSFSQLHTDLNLDSERKYMLDSCFQLKHTNTSNALEHTFGLKLTNGRMSETELHTLILNICPS